MPLVAHRRCHPGLLLVVVVLATTIHTVESTPLMKGPKGTPVNIINHNSPYGRILQKDNDNNNNDNKDKNRNNGKNNKDQQDEARQDDNDNADDANTLIIMTLAPTTVPPTTVPPTTVPPTDRPTIRPTVAAVPVEQVIDEAFLPDVNEINAVDDPTLDVDESQPAIVTTVVEEDTASSSTNTADTTTTSTSVTLSMEDLRDIQYLGSGTVTLRISLWFQDGRDAAELTAGTTMNRAVLLALQQVLCETDSSSSTETESSLSGTTTAPYEFTTNANTAEDDDSADGVDAEERELCVVQTEVSSSGARQSTTTTASLERSILLQPPTTYVVDRNTDGDGSLQWTTWRVTWDVLRLGTFSILQGLENAAPVTTTSSSTTENLSQEDVYRAGVSAMEQVLDLRLQVAIRENAFDPLLVESMAAVGGGSDTGLVVSSVYGEEEASLAPKLAVLGLTGSTTASSNTMNSNGTSVTADGATEDDEFDDDRYSMEYGITEQLDPEFWHPLRIVGFFLFALTTTVLVALSCLSKKRQARRVLEQKLAKESKGLLNNPQGVEDMLRASEKRPGKEQKDDVVQNIADADNDRDITIPLPTNLKASR